MHKLEYIIKNINPLNIILITAIIFLANYTVLPMFNMSIKYTLPSGKKTVTNKEENTVESHVPSPSDYTMIAEENLFHPERKIPVEKKEEQPLPKPEFVLYGTLITDDMSLAYLEDLKAPYNTPGRGKRQTALKKGDTMSGFALKDIEADKIVMVRGDDRMVVYLNDSHKPKTREASLPVTQAAPRLPGQPAYTPPQQPTAQQPVTPPKQAVKPQRAPVRSEDAKKNFLEYFQRGIKR